MTVHNLRLMLNGLESLVGPRCSRFGVLIFHRVLPEPDPLQPDEICAAQFDELVGVLVKYFNVLGVDEALELWRSGRLPPRSLVITFDDGYADNFTVAYPILRKHGVQAVFFVASGYLDGGIMFNDVVIEAVRRTPAESLDLNWLGAGVHELQSVSQRRALIHELLGRVKYLSLNGRQEALERFLQEARVVRPTDLMMTSNQLQAMFAGGMTIGGHTMNHPILAVLDDDAAWHEIASNRQHLTDLLGVCPRFFAYPNGKPGADYTAQSVSLVEKAGYEAAFTTTWGSVGRESGAYELPRFTPWDKGRARFCVRLALNFLRVDVDQLAVPVPS